MFSLHIIIKESRIFTVQSVLLQEEPFFPPPEEYGDYTFGHCVDGEKRVRAPKGPAKRDECEVCGNHCNVKVFT